MPLCIVINSLTVIKTTDMDMRIKKLARTAAIALWVSFMTSSCGGSGGGAGVNNNNIIIGVARVPLNDLGSGNYLGYVGGLYPNGTITPPAAHAALGLSRAQAVTPRDITGTLDPAGKMVMVSIGMSNTTQEFCSKPSTKPCDPWTFMGQAANDMAVNKNTLVIVNGALASQVATDWDSSKELNYDRILDNHLTPQGLSEQQVQVAWVKVARPNPAVSLPASNADAYELVINLGNIMRALKQRYPNLQQVFLSSRIYAGYATSSLNPEPYAYETGFAVKWLIQAQIDQMQNGVVDPRAGDLNANNGTMPWLAWGPYLWADGVNPRSDSLVWNSSDFETTDYTHPAQGAEIKVADQLLAFFKNSEFTRCWFTNSGTCP